VVYGAHISLYIRQHCHVVKQYATLSKLHKMR